MQAEKKDHMKDALQSRRGKGLEIIIGMGRDAGGNQGDVDGRDGISGTREGESNYDSKRSDLAPPPARSNDGPLNNPEPEMGSDRPLQDKGKLSDMLSAEGAHAPHPDAIVAGQHEMAPGDVPTMDDAKAHFSQNMSEEDIKDMADRKPRSLMERARQHAFAQKKQ